ncbi:MAG: hypothetical protein ACTSUD_04090 [Alphaproteobacteria bacterium]
MSDTNPSARRLAEERAARKRAEGALEKRTAALARAKAEVKETRTRFLDFAKIASDWLWEMDAELRFTELIGYKTDTTGLTREEVIGKTLIEIGLFGIDEKATLR